MDVSRRSNAGGGFRFPQGIQTLIASRNWMTTRVSPADDSPIASLRPSACSPAPQATPSPARGGLVCGTIHSGCRWGLEGIHSACPRCRTRSGSSARRRRIIYRSKTFALSGTKWRRSAALRLRVKRRTLHLPLPLRGLRSAWQRMDSSHKHFVRRGFIRC